MSKIVFLNLAEGRSVELKINGDSTWMDVADEFVYFLQGSGYQVTREDIADHFNEGRSTELDFDIDDFGITGHDDVNATSDYNINIKDMLTTGPVYKNW